MQTGQIISKLRAESGLSQEALASKLFVSRELVSKWEIGKRQPDYKTVLKLAEIFGVSADTIIERNTGFLEKISELIPENTDENALEEKLNKFLGTLKDRDRSVFLRRYYYLEEIPEICSHYNISAHAVRTILMRTRNKLKKYFNEEEHQ